MILLLHLLVSFSEQLLGKLIRCWFLGPSSTAKRDEWMPTMLRSKKVMHFWNMVFILGISSLVQEIWGSHSSLNKGTKGGKVIILHVDGTGCCLTSLFLPFASPKQWVQYEWPNSNPSLCFLLRTGNQGIVNMSVLKILDIDSSSTKKRT